MPDLEKVKKTLETLRDIPANTDSAGEDVLGLISDFLLGISSGDAPVHWFCNRADKLTVDSATFLLRLHGYSSERIQNWRVQLARCLRGCSACIRGLSEAKISSKHTCVHLKSFCTLTNQEPTLDSLVPFQKRFSKLSGLIFPSGN
jgi:senataxin